MKRAAVEEAHVAQNREQTPANSPHGRVRDPQPNKGPGAANSLQVRMAAGLVPSGAFGPQTLGQCQTPLSGTTKHVAPALCPRA